MSRTTCSHRPDRGARRRSRSRRVAERADRRSRRRCGRRARGSPRASTTPTGVPPRSATATSTAGTRTPPSGRSRRRWPSSRAPRSRWRSRRAWARSPRRCSRSARRGEPHRRPTPAVRGHARVPAGSVPPDGHRRHVRRRGEPGAFAAAVEPGRTMLVLAESPSNPLLEFADLDELGSIRGPFTVVDSTFSTPLGQQPLAHGVDLVAALGDQGHRRPQRRHARRDLGRGRSARRDLGVLGAARRHPVAVRRAQRPARHPHAGRSHPPAERDRRGRSPITLADHPEVRAVHYPGLSEHPQHELATKQLRQYGTVLSFEVAGSQTRPRRS